MSSDRIEIIRELRALEKFCAFPPNMNGEDRERFLKDYLADIQEFPLSAIQKACQKWRTSGQAKFPTPGQLIPLIRGCMAAEPRESVEVWRPLSDDEYRALTVREKIRHHQILSHEAYTKAGPMFRNTSQGPRMSGVHLTPDEMDANYRKWTDLGKHHAQEAHRLRQYVRGTAQGLAAE